MTANLDDIQGGGPALAIPNDIEVVAAPAAHVPDDIQVVSAPPPSAAVPDDIEIVNTPGAESVAPTPPATEKAANLYAPAGASPTDWGFREGMNQPGPEDFDNPAQAIYGLARNAPALGASAEKALAAVQTELTKRSLEAGFIPGAADDVSFPQSVTPPSPGELANFERMNLAQEPAAARLPGATPTPQQAVAQLPQPKDSAERFFSTVGEFAAIPALGPAAVPAMGAAMMGEDAERLRQQGVAPSNALAAGAATAGIKSALFAGSPLARTAVGKAASSVASELVEQGLVGAGMTATDRTADTIAQGKNVTDQLRDPNFYKEMAASAATQAAAHGVVRGARATVSPSSEQAPEQQPEASASPERVPDDIEVVRPPEPPAPVAEKPPAPVPTDIEVVQTPKLPEPQGVRPQFDPQELAGAMRDVEQRQQPQRTEVPAPPEVPAEAPPEPLESPSEGASPPPVDLNAMKFRELKELADARRVSLRGVTSRDELVRRLGGTPPERAPKEPGRADQRKQLELQLRNLIVQEHGPDISELPSSHPLAMQAFRGEAPLGSLISAASSFARSAELPEDHPARVVLHNLQELEKNPRGTKFRR
jgi:hypothetical protein